MGAGAPTVRQVRTSGASAAKKNAELHMCQESGVPETLFKDLPIILILFLSRLRLTCFFRNRLMILSFVDDCREGKAIHI